MHRKLIFAVLLLPLGSHATEYRTIEHPRQECWNERVAVQSPGYGGAVIGGLTGGLLGNQVGGGNGRTVATAIGAATGAVVGDRLSADSGYRSQQRCRTVIDRQQVAVYPSYREYREPVRYRQAPVIEERIYYVDRDIYRHHHRHHKHHRHDDDDDD